jgi:hypothetical protein
MGLFSKEEPKHLKLRTGERLDCKVCGFDRFFFRRGQLNTALATFFSLDWVDATAECWVCGRCGYVHWFLGD